MSAPVTVEITTTAKITVDLVKLAEVFAAFNDETQAQFFIEVARIARAWPDTSFRQWWSVGRHLRNCSCSTDEARELIQELHEGIQP